MKVLFTGFESMEGGATGASWSWISEANEHVGIEHMAYSLRLPPVWDDCFFPLRSLLSQNWDAVVCVGEKDTSQVAVERLAINEANVAFKDAKERRPRNKIINTTGEAGYWSGLPYRELGTVLSAASIPAFASHSAGSELPNYLFYQLMHWISENKTNLVAGLVQVPRDGSILSSDPDVSSRFVNCILNTLNRSAEQDDSLMVDPSRLKIFKESPKP